MTNRTSLPFASLALLLVAACGGNVAISSSDSTSGSGASTGTSTSTGAMASTGATTSSSSGTATSSTGTSGAGGGACVGSIDLVVNQGAPPVPKHLTSICANVNWNPKGTTQPEGYVFEGGPPPGIQDLVLLGCASSAPKSEGIDLRIPKAMSPGTYISGSPRYTAPGGDLWGFMGDPLEVTITKLGVVGDSIDGTFTATVSKGGNAALWLSGSFHVCRAPDELAP